MSPVASAPIGSFDVARRIRASVSETLAFGPVASVEASPLLCTTLRPSLKEGVCDDTFLLIYTRAENHTHTHLNHTHI